MPLVPENKKQFLNKAEDVAEEVFRTTKHVLPHFARACLLSTFLEDGIRMWFQWNDQVVFMNDRWSCGAFAATLFVVLNFFCQLAPCLLIFARKFVDVACGVLFFVIIVQMFAYNIISDMHFLAKSFAVVGGLVLLLAETRVENRSLFAGVPSVSDTNKTKSLMQLIGRVLLVCMFLSLLTFQLDVFRVFELVVGGFFMALIVVGYKTKLCALALVVWMTGMNLYLNRWWAVSEDSWYRDFLKYDFFQTLSIIGGLLMIVQMGAGHLSVDDYKKRW